MPLSKICKKCGNKFFVGSGFYDYCRRCRKENPQLEQKELERILIERGFVKIRYLGFAKVSEVGIPKNYLPQEAMERIRNKLKDLPPTFSIKDFKNRKKTVVLLVEGDAGLKLATMKANEYGYELMNVSSSRSAWTPFTKYTCIFKKPKIESEKQ